MISNSSLRWLSPLLLLAAFAAAATADEPSREQSIRAELKDLGAKFQVTQRFLGVDPFPDQSGLWIDEEWKGTDEDLAKLKLLSDITSITVEGTQVTDAWMKHVAAMPKLSSVAVKRSKITVDGVAELLNLPNLQELSIYYAPLGDEVVEHLAAMQGLTVLKLYGGQFSERGKESLAAAFEGTATVLDLRKGAFLGVSCIPHPAGCMINYVREGSAGAKAGLQQGDVLVRYNGKKVADFVSLTTFIAQDSPGTEVEVEILRNAEIVTKRVILGYWE
jgi:hypothetical protein